jgi:DHA2 family multidrug resistance protein
MTGFSFDTTQYTIVTTSIVQGVGLGLLFVPVTNVAFSTLPGNMRNGGTAITTLVRNIGSSIGISMVIANLTSKTTQMHERIGENVTPFNNALQFPDIASILNTGTDAGRAMLDAIVTQQAAVIAYANDFKLLMVLCILSMPLVFVIGKSRAPQAGAGAPAHAALD